jgi:hypothetical protein
MRSALLCVLVLLASCSKKSSQTADAGPDDTADADIEETCVPTGMNCAVDDDCCTSNCDPDMGVCVAAVVAVCKPAGQACQVGPDCCTFACIGGTCSANQCTGDGQACTTDGECCGGTCGTNGTCTPINTSCKSSGNSCTANSQCCSKYCVDDLCSPSPSFCVQAGDTCSQGADCCGGICTIAAGQVLGTCTKAAATGASQCTSAGEVCGAGADYMGGELPVCGGECCSKACFPYGPTGVLICQPPSGCRPTGELCKADSDCCGSLGNLDGATSKVKCQKKDGNPVGRCDSGNSCTPAGGICRLQTSSCSANANCCAGNTLNNDTCRKDALGIPRCLYQPVDCTDPTTKIGEACASSADCCGLPCVDVPGMGLICAGDCVQTGDSCTTSADCCTTLPCVVPPGSTSGTCGLTIGCADFGQSCTMNSDCCNGLPCHDGKCQAVIF